jgi:hypothetical protein
MGMATMLVPVLLIMRMLMMPMVMMVVILMLPLPKHLSGLILLAINPHIHLRG